MLSLLLVLLWAWWPSRLTEGKEKPGPSPLTVAAQAKVPTPASFDVIHYEAEIEPDINAKTVKGKVLIQIAARRDNLGSIDLDCGELIIDAVRDDGKAQEFKRIESRLSIVLSRFARANEKRVIEVVYRGSPRRGIRFFPEREQVYTVFSTSQWMVCKDAPDDKATLRMRIILPAQFSAVANGSLTSQRAILNHKVVFEWKQERPIPTYTFGFVAGRFRTISDKKGRVEFRYVTGQTGATGQFSDDQLRRIFRDTRDMLDFYERRAGVPYADKAYTQVLAAGGVAQEMSGFTAIKEAYGQEVLSNERAIWLGAHEFAHQWWGNMVTCRDWNHFWLNEGMANFMTAAYLGHRFGPNEYSSEIDKYRVSYKKVRDAGKDKSLVFPDWLRPTMEDRTLVYDKGAYVLHLLRQEMGETAFWKGIRSYTRRYFERSVTTAEFQAAMEEANGKSLESFFAKWVYLRGLSVTDRD
jgi:aminopeptidase N